jgi:enamine deaminase RidA (YjgF/YER057c/UK114 family)
MLIPLPSHLSDILKRLMVLIEEILWKLAHVLTILKLGGSDLRSVFEITIFVQDLMDFVFDFSLKVKILE